MKNRRHLPCFNHTIFLMPNFVHPQWKRKRTGGETSSNGASAIFSSCFTVSDIQELNQYLLEQCDAYEETFVPKTKEKVGERFLLEKQQLLPIIGTHPCTRKVKAYVNSLSLVNFETNANSVPTKYAGRKNAEIHAYVNHIEIKIDGNCVTKHERSYERLQEIFEVNHYLDELERKQGLQHARPVRRANLPPSYQEFY